MSVIDEVKQKTDIVEVIGQHTTLIKAGRTFRALCPFHSEKNPSFFVYPEQQSWHCFGACSTGGDVFSFVMKKQGIDFGEALRLLAERAGVTIASKPEPGTGRDKKERLYQVNEAAARYFHNLLLGSPAGERAKSYVASRGLLLKSITDFQLGFSLNSWEALKQHLLERGCAEGELLEAGLLVTSDEGKTHDRFRNRLMFPIGDAKGRITGFGARALDDSLPKYLNSPQTPVFDKSSILYGINLALPAIRQQDLAVIVEGYMDVVTAHQNGFANVVASMGTSITDTQISTLKKLSRNIALALDADAAGEEAMLRCVSYENSLDAEVKVIILPAGKDPDDVMKEDTKTWQHLQDAALPVIDYMLNTVTARLDLTKAKDKSLATGKLLPVIAQVKDSIRQDHYLTRLAKLAGISYNKLEAALGNVRDSRKPRLPSQESATRVLQPVFSNPTEQYCLALLLQHPHLKDNSEGLLPEYFENSENREVFLAWQEASDLSSMKDKLDTAICEYLDTLINKSIPATNMEQKYTDCVLRLQERYLRDLEGKRAAALALEKEVAGSVAELAMQKEQGIETSIQLGKVFAQKPKGGGEQRR